MYPKLLSAAVVAGMFPGTCDSTLSLYDPQLQELTWLVAADSDFDFALGGKAALLQQDSDPPPDPPPDEPVEPREGPHDPE